MGGFALQVAWRLYLSWGLIGPIVHDDEDGYLLAARVLAGGPAATLPSWSIMRPMGYPLLISPAYWFFDLPSRVYKAVHVINALMMSTSFPLLYVIGRRLFGTSRQWTAAAAFVLALLPSLVFFGEFALTDVVLPEMLLILVLAIYSMVAGRRPRLAGLVAGVVAGYAAGTHVRGLVMLVVLVVLAVVGSWRRWFGWRVAAATAGGAGIVYAAGSALNGWLEHQLFPGTGAFRPDDRILERLTTLHGAFRVLADGAGQLWYLCVSTYGLAALGIVAVIVMLVRREGSLGTRIALGTALVMNVGIALATATGIPDENRVNNHIYGRYVALFAGLWSLVAVVSVAKATWRRSAVLVGGATIFVLSTIGLVVLYAHNRMPTESFVSFDAPEASFLSHDYRAVHLTWMTTLTIGLIVVVAALATGWLSSTRTFGVRRHAAAVAGGAALTGVNLLAMVWITAWVVAGSQWHQYHPGAAQLMRNARVHEGDTVAEASNVPWPINQRHQHEVFWAALPTFDPAGPPPGEPDFVVSLPDWPGARYGYKVVLKYRGIDTVAWVVWRRI